MSKSQKPSFFRRGAITQRSSTHGPTLKGGIVYGANAKDITAEIARHIHDTIIDRHADPSLGRGVMIEPKAADEKGNSLQPNEDMIGGWPPEDAVSKGPSRQGKRSQVERSAMADGTYKKRGRKGNA